MDGRLTNVEGRTFQALLASSAFDVASSVGMGSTATMYAQRDDRAAGDQLQLERLGYERRESLGEHCTINFSPV